MAPLDPRYTQVGFNSISVQVWQALFLDISLELDWAQEFQNVEFLNKFLEFFHGNVLSFELFKEKCGFLLELVTKNDEKWGTPGFFLGFLSLFRLKI